MESPDLIAALETIVDEARSTQHKLALGLAVTGVTGLARIRVIASDAIADAREQETERAAA